MSITIYQRGGYTIHRIHEGRRDTPIQVTLTPDHLRFRTPLIILTDGNPDTEIVQVLLDYSQDAPCVIRGFVTKQVDTTTILEYPLAAKYFQLCLEREGN